MSEIKVQYYLFLDDIRNPQDVMFYKPHTSYNHDNWKIVRDYNEFVECIELYWSNHQTFPALVSFDHDLADVHYKQENQSDIDYDSLEEKTGYDCAKWLVEFCMNNNLKFPQYLVHSMNKVGAHNIEAYIENYIKRVENESI
jgi:hypothetical protein